MTSTNVCTAAGQIVLAQSFEEKMKERIKDSIGDLIGDEDLTKMIHRGIEEAFFAKRYEKNHNGWDSKTVEKEPLIHEILKSLLQPMITEAVKEWLVAHEDEVKKMVSDTVNGGAGVAVLAAITGVFHPQMAMLESNVSMMMQTLHNMPR